MTTASPLLDADRQAARERADRLTDADRQAARERADRLTDAAFAPGRPTRSPEYIAGVRARLRYSFADDKIVYPYPSGTAAADAFFAGMEEGRLIHRMQD